MDDGYDSLLTSGKYQCLQHQVAMSDCQRLLRDWTFELLNYIVERRKNIFGDVKSRIKVIIFRIEK